jgi:hypothetical protein
VWTYPNGHVCPYFNMVFATRTFLGAPASDGRENLKVRWFSPAALPEVLPTVALTNPSLPAVERDWHLPNDMT